MNAIAITIWDDLGRELGVEDFKAPGPMMNLVLGAGATISSPSLSWRFFGLEPVPVSFREMFDAYEEDHFPVECLCVIRH